MAERISRRELGRLAAGAAVAAAVPAGLGQDPPKPEARAAEVSAELAQIEAKLTIKLTDQTRKLAEEAVRANLSASDARWKTKLPENSEPCFTFQPNPVGRNPR